MIVNRQPSYSWIGLLIGLILVGTIIATVGFTHNDILNPMSSGAAATATLSAVNYDGQSRLLSLNATATAMAIAAESDRLNAKLAPTRTAIADAIQQKRNDEEYGRNSNLSALGAYVLLTLFAVAALLGMLAVLHRAIQSDRIRMAESKAILAAKQAELIAAEGMCFEKEAAMLREQRRNIEIEAIVPVGNRRQQLHLVQNPSPNGDDPKVVRKVG
jgi:hypothetical protein